MFIYKKWDLVIYFQSLGKSIRVKVVTKQRTEKLFLSDKFYNKNGLLNKGVSFVTHILF